MLKMVAVPLIVTSLLSGVLNLGTGAGVGRMFRRTLTYYMATSFLAIVTGLLVVNLVRPGLQNGQAAVAAVAVDSHAAKPLGEVLFEQVEAMIPANTIGAFAEPNFLSIIAFTIAFALFSLKAGNAVAASVARAADVGFSCHDGDDDGHHSFGPHWRLFLDGGRHRDAGAWRVCGARVLRAGGFDRPGHPCLHDIADHPVGVCQTKSHRILQGDVAGAFDRVQ